MYLGTFIMYVYDFHKLRTGKKDNGKARQWQSHSGDLWDAWKDLKGKKSCISS
jgi:hypothetical protein